MKKTTAAIAIAALAVPAAAQADKPENAGSQGRENAKQHQSKHQRKSTRTRTVGFVVSGVVPASGGGLSLADDRKSFSGAPSFDVTSANKHARRALGLERSDIRGASAVTLDRFKTGDEFVLRLVGLTDATQLQAGDRVKIIGRVERTRERGSERTSRTSGKRATVQFGDVDIRRVIVKRRSGETEQEQAEQPKQQS